MHKTRRFAHPHKPLSMASCGSPRVTSLQNNPVSESPLLRGHKLKFVDGVICHNEYRKTYSTLSMRERKRREIGLAQHVLAVFIDKDTLREKGMAEIIGNIDVAVDIVHIIDAICMFLQEKFRVNLNNITISQPLTLLKMKNRKMFLHPQINTRWPSPF